MSAGEEFGNSFIERAWELPEEVVMPRPVVETKGLQPEDLGAMLALLLLPEGEAYTAKDMAAYLREKYGWKMSDERFGAISKRLRAAGHMERRSVFNPKTGRPEWRYRIYRNPANNPEYVDRGAAEASQVKAENRETRVSLEGENRERRVPRGQDRKPGNPASGAETAKGGFPSVDVPAGQARNPGNPVFGSHPPLPPGGGTTPPPTPSTDGARQHPPQTEEEGVFDEKDLEAAADFLQNLPDPWIVGEKDATDIAPELLARMQLKEWPSIHEVDRPLLASCIATNPGGANNLVSILRTKRIPNLRAYTRATARAARGAARERCPDHPARYRTGCIDCAMAVPA